MLDQAAIQQQQLAEVLEARAEEKKALAEALARVRELELSAAAALGLSAAGGRAAVSQRYHRVFHINPQAFPWFRCVVPL